MLQLYYSSATAPYHCVTFFLAGVLLLTSLGFETPLRSRPRVVLLLEALVTFSLIAEVFLKAVVLGSGHLRSCSGALDATMGGLSAVFLFFEAPTARFGEQKRVDLELSQSLVMLRILVQFGRLLVIAEHAHRAGRLRAATSPFDELGLDFSNLRRCELEAQWDEEDFI
mmetsp:Transcript_36708/g.104432  ORF Transcript_36708/g.104432 Transcript_36708/m.104432 type:complete len:169 (-) Transcript_36708:112-618(-)